METSRWRALGRWLFALVVVPALIGGPVAFAFHQQSKMRNFRIVEPGVLYRSGQISLSALKRLVHDYGIKTVVTLRDAYVPDKAPPDLAEEEYCRKEEITYVRIPPRRWSSHEGAPPVDQGVQRFLDVMSDPKNHPVLLHCFAGTHRTGAYCEIYRMEFEGWSNARAIQELKTNGYTNLEEEWDILEYLEQYQPKRKR